MISCENPLFLTMFPCENPGGRTEDNAVIQVNEKWRKPTVCCSLPTSTSNPYSRGNSQQTVPIHQQRVLDLCGSTFQLTTSYTPILDSRSQTSALKWPRPRPHIFSKTGTTFTLSKSGMVAYQGGVHSVDVCIVIIILCRDIIIIILTKQAHQVHTTGWVWQRTRVVSWLAV